MRSFVRWNRKVGETEKRGLRGDTTTKKTLIYDVSAHWVIHEFYDSLFYQFCRLFLKKKYLFFLSIKKNICFHLKNTR